MKGFYIDITNNLLDPKHRKAMGTAVWEFMWCLDKITIIDKEGKASPCNAASSDLSPNALRSRKE